MIDLETLGRRPGCKILSLGAVVFDGTGLGSEFYSTVKIADQGLLTVDVKTLEWWSQQDPEVSGPLFEDQALKPNLRDVLTLFGQWLEGQAVVDNSAGALGVRIWGNGADFDNAILQVAYAAVMPHNPPWLFWNNRCYRTLKSLVPVIKMTRQGNHHHALDDARSQAEHAVKLLRFLQFW